MFWKPCCSYRQHGEYHRYGEDERDGKTEGDGLISDGAAVSIVDRNYPGGAPVVDIKGGEFNSEKSEAVLDYTWDSANKVASEWTEAGEFVDISGGTFSTEPREELLAEGFGPNTLPGGGYGVHEHKWADEVQFDESGHWKTCTLCDETTAVAPHELSAEWATDAESHWHACSGCGYTAEKAAHQFGDWTVTKEATATEAGSREHACATCGLTVSEVIPALGGGADQGSSDQQKPGSDQEKPALALTGDSLTAPVTLAGVAIAAAAVALVAFALRRRQSVK